MYSPGDMRTNFTNELQSIFLELKLDAPNNYYILAGDLNAKHTFWGDDKSNSRGTALLEWFNDNRLKFRTSLMGPEIATYPAGNSFLDLAIYDARVKVINSTNNKSKVYPYDSDHKAILLKIKIENLDEFLFTPSQTKNYNFNKTNWEKFKKNLEKIQLNIPSNKNLLNNEIDNFIGTLNNNIINELHKVTPKYKNNDSIKRYTNKEIKQLQSLKSKILTEIHKLNKKFIHNGILISALKNALVITRNKLKKIFDKNVNEYWYDKISKIKSHDSQNMFPQIKSIFKNNNTSEIPNIIIETNNTELINNETINIDKCQKLEDKVIISNPQDKANVLARYLANINNMKRDSSSPRLEQIIKNTINNFIDRNKINNEQHAPIINFTTQNNATNPKFEQNPTFFYNYYSLRKIILKLNNKKSTGIDKIPTIALKNLSSNFIVYYLIIFNNLLNNGYFPDEWKLAKVVPILKKNKDPSKVSSYRPISLLPNTGKLFEILITKTLNKYIEENQLLPYEQFGFRYGTSTIHAITKFTHDIASSLNNNEVVAACLIDLEKAFDTAWIEGVLFRLIKKGVPDYLLKILWNLLKGKKMYVSLNDKTNSRQYSLENGVQQGAVSSPLLFNIFMSDILSMYDINTSPSLKGIGFADDLVIYCRNKNVNLAKNELQATFHKIINYFNTWKLKCNVEKCETILFRPLIDNMSKKTGRAGAYSVSPLKIVTKK